MATYVAQSPAHAGTAVAFTSPPANGDIAPTGAGLSLLVVNPTANGTITVVLAPSITDDGLVVGSRTVSILQATSWLIPLAPSVYGAQANLTYTGTLTTVQVAVISSPGS